MQDITNRDIYIKEVLAIGAQWVTIAYTES